MLILASNFGGGEIFTRLAAGSLCFLIMLAASLAIARKKPGMGGLVALIWAVLYPFAQVFLTTRISEGPLEILLLVGIPSVVTAALLAWCTRSWIPGAGCAAGVAVAVLLMKDGSFSSWAPEFLWNLCVGTSLVLWGVLARRAIRPVGLCEACGYDLRGTVGRVCPECGGTGLGQKERSST